MKAAILRALHQLPNVEDHPIPVPQKGKVRVRLRCAALNRRDYWIIKGAYPKIQLPVILGSDGMGFVDEVGEGVKTQWQERRVLIDPGLFWGADNDVQSRRFQVLGMPADGTLAEYVTVPEENIYEAPAHLSDAQAAALPLAGVTAYRALFTRGKLQPTDRVLITGIGSGVATMALLLALPTGADVWVSSSREEKIEKAVNLGARGGFVYSDSQWTRKALAETDGFTLIIDGGGGTGFARLVDVAAFGARIVIYGGTSGAIEGLLPARIFWKQLDIRGTTMGSPRDFRRMLRWVTRHHIRPLIDTEYPLDAVHMAFERLASADHMGKIVVRITC